MHIRLMVLCYRISLHKRWLMVLSIISLCLSTPLQFAAGLFGFFSLLSGGYSYGAYVLTLLVSTLFTIFQLVFAGIQAVGISAKAKLYLNVGPQIPNGGPSSGVQVTVTQVMFPNPQENLQQTPPVMGQSYIIYPGMEDDGSS